MRVAAPAALVLLLATAAAVPPQRAAAQQSRSAASGPPSRLAAPHALPSLAQPALSPDGSEIAFVQGGDVWAVPAAGGAAHLLVSHAANESRPLYSPDGTRLAFVSDRAGSDDLYVLDLASGAVTRVTFGDGGESLDAWSPDGRWLYFTSGDQDIGGMTDVFRVPAAGGTPMAVVNRKNVPEYFAAPSPDGRTIAIDAVARMGFSQWWRHGHAHIDEAEVWLVTDAGGASAPGAAGAAGARPTYTRLTEPGTKNLWPMWTPDGSAVVFMSDRDGNENLWERPVGGGAARQLTRFTGGRVLWPSMSRDGRAVVFERDFSIWRMDLPDGQPQKVAVELRGAAQGPTVEHVAMTDDFGDLALSPDGKKLAFVARGDVYATGAKDGGATERVTTTVGPESTPAWSPDSRRIAYTSRRDGVPQVFVYDFGTREETRVSPADAPAATPAWSPDGKRIAYARDGKELVVVGADGRGERVVARGLLWKEPFAGGRPLAFSPDGKWLAFLASDERRFTNVWVVPADGSAPGRPVSRLANGFANTLAWAPDGTALYFDTQQRTEDGQIARVDLVPRTPTFRDSAFWAMFADSAKPGSTSKATRGAQATSPASTPDVAIDFDGVFRRLSLLPLGVDVNELTLAPDGKSVVFTASAEGQFNLYSFPLDPLSDAPPVAKQLTSTPGGKGLPAFTPDGKEIYYVDRGHIHALTLDGGKDRAIAAKAERDVAFDPEKVEAFDEGWTWLRDDFFDADMHGADWDAVKATFAPHVAGARTRPELERLMNLMLGELNASHLGHHEPRPDLPDAETGRLGISLDPAAYASGRVLRVASVVPLGPADVAGVRAGDVLVSVNGVAVDSASSLDRLLDHTVGDRVRVGIEGEAEAEAEAKAKAKAEGRAGAGGRVVEVQPVSSGARRELAYRAWVNANRAYVDSISGGRIGYVHMPDMSWESLQQLKVDLDAANFGKDGVVIDVRANRGGFVNAYALDVFARKGYMTLETRGYPAAPARSQLGQRALEAPTALVTDRNSLSDAEDFTEGYRTLKLGPVVGEPTGGWIIYTWGTQLVDGSSFRLPRSRVRAHDGEVMEMHPRGVDVPVATELGVSGDPQLDAAVRALLGKG